MLDFNAYLGGGGGQNAFSRLAAEQYLRLLMTLDDFFDLALRMEKWTDEQTNNANSRVA